VMIFPFAEEKLILGVLLVVAVVLLIKLVRRVKKYFDSLKNIRKIRNKSYLKKEKVFWRSRKTPVLLTLCLVLSNCNTGISFHSVMQNIFITFRTLNGYIFIKHENPFTIMKEVIFSIL